MVCDYMRKHSCGSADVTEHLSKLVQLDESCTEAVELARSLLKGKLGANLVATASD